MSCGRVWGDFLSSESWLRKTGWWVKDEPLRRVGMSVKGWGGRWRVKTVKSRQVSRRLGRTGCSLEDDELELWKVGKSVEGWEELVVLRKLTGWGYHKQDVAYEECLTNLVVSNTCKLYSKLLHPYNTHDQFILYE